MATLTASSISGVMLLTCSKVKMLNAYSLSSMKGPMPLMRCRSSASATLGHAEHVEVQRVGFLGDALQFLGLFERLLVQLRVHAKQNLGLSHPLVTLHAAGEELDGDVDFLLQFRGHVRNLAVGRDAQRVQLLFDERPNALDDLKVVLGAQ